jgi:hypothetical protein
MKPIAKVAICQIMAVISLCSCKKSNDTISEPPGGTTPTYPMNLITNSSFESDSTFTLEKWSKWGGDTTYINILSALDVPPGGGTFSVSVKSGSMPLWNVGYISYGLTAPVGPHRYRLAVWGKGYGMVTLSLGPDVRKRLWFSDPTWVEQSLLDTLSTTSSHAVRITLGPDFDFPRQSWNILFDLCRFEQLD